MFRRVTRASLQLCHVAPPQHLAVAPLVWNEGQTHSLGFLGLMWSKEGLQTLVLNRTGQDRMDRKAAVHTRDSLVGSVELAPPPLRKPLSPLVILTLILPPARPSHVYSF